MSAAHCTASASLANRFWPKVEKGDGCWIWTGARYKNGYGYLTVEGERRTTIGAHRVSWQLHFGPIPAGLSILHRCDNPACVNPEHLWAGTPRQNTQDMVKKGRNRHSERHPQAKLTVADVLAMRRIRVATGLPYRRLGRLFGVCAQAAWNIVNRRVWGRV